MARRVRVYLDEHELERFETFARERAWSKSHAIRAAIRAFTSEAADDPLLELSGDIDGLPADLSRDFHRYLNETFVTELPASMAWRK